MWFFKGWWIMWFFQNNICLISSVTDLWMENDFVIVFSKLAKYMTFWQEKLIETNEVSQVDNAALCCSLDFLEIIGL